MYAKEDLIIIVINISTFFLKLCCAVWIRTIHRNIIEKSGGITDALLCKRSLADTDERDKEREMTKT